jgi:hypothetical protein
MPWPCGSSVMDSRFSSASASAIRKSKADNFLG